MTVCVEGLLRDNNGTHFRSYGCYEGWNFSKRMQGEVDSKLFGLVSRIGSTPILGNYIYFCHTLCGFGKIKCSCCETVIIGGSLSESFRFISMLTLLQAPSNSFMSCCSFSPMNLRWFRYSLSTDTSLLFQSSLGNVFSSVAVLNDFLEYMAEIFTTFLINQYDISTVPLTGIHLCIPVQKNIFYVQCNLYIEFELID